ncbi:hypothetical protein BJ742DRAFT_787015 [Cladochytrium replicatum]|nr:hypothetical protein BJ742DRAFT_787015 [Cladochytrium replicatum]
MEDVEGESTTDGEVQHTLKQPSTSQSESALSANSKEGRSIIAHSPHIPRAPQRPAPQPPTAFDDRSPIGLITSKADASHEDSNSDSSPPSESSVHQGIENETSQRRNNRSLNLRTALEPHEKISEPEIETTRTRSARPTRLDLPHKAVTKAKIGISRADGTDGTAITPSYHSPSFAAITPLTPAIPSRYTAKCASSIQLASPDMGSSFNQLVDGSLTANRYESLPTLNGSARLDGLSPSTNRLRKPMSYNDLCNKALREESRVLYAKIRKISHDQKDQQLRQSLSSDIERFKALKAELSGDLVRTQNLLSTVVEASLKRLEESASDRQFDVDRMSHSELIDEKCTLKRELHALRDFAVASTSNTPKASTSDVLIIRKLYERYCSIKGRIRDQIDFDLNKTIPVTPSRHANYRSLKHEKREIQVQLLEYQESFKMKHGRAPFTVTDRKPVEDLYMRYKELKGELSNVSPG